VSDGTAKLVAEPLSLPERNDACYEESCNYVSGMLTTARPNINASQYPLPFTYGYVESRLKFPALPGFFTAFWMVPTDPTFNYKSEIDIVEILGSDPTSMFMTYAYDNRSQLYKVNKQPRDNGACPVSDYSTDWVQFGVNWQPDRIAWYIDGTKCGEFSDAAWIENGPMQLILGLMVNTNWAREVNSVVQSESPVAQLEVDYIRLYQQH
jgi:beta-glucanase (GH16 family)